MLLLLLQGPLPETIGDFWRMVWEQHVPSVVMMTKLEERNRVCVSSCSVFGVVLAPRSVGEGPEFSKGAVTRKICWSCVQMCCFWHTNWHIVTKFSSQMSNPFTSGSQKVLSLSCSNKREMDGLTFIFQHNHGFCQCTIYSNLQFLDACKIKRSGCSFSHSSVAYLSSSMVENLHPRRCSFIFGSR